MRWLLLRGKAAYRVRPDMLDEDRVRSYLGPTFTAVPLYFYDRLRSTNDTAARLFQQQIDEAFLAVMAEKQEAGRGRQGRTWISPAHASLLLSIAFRYPSYATIKLEQWPLLAALCVQRVLDYDMGLNVTIKWPNDIRIAGKKVAGILTERRDAHTQSLILGIGMNVTTKQDEFALELRDKAGSLAMFTANPIDRNHLAATLLREIHQMYLATLQGLTFHDVHHEFISHCDTVGQRVRLSQGSVLFDGLVKTIDDEGTLHFVTGDGRSLTFISGEIIEVLS